MQKYDVTGMSCAACVARVEKAVGKVEGVQSCSVNLLTNSMTVDGNVSAKDIVDAVKKAGYGAQIKGQSVEKNSGSADEEDSILRDTETPILRKRLFYSLGFLIVLMYFSMGHMMWGWPLPAFFNHNHIAVALVQMILASIIMLINKKFFINGFKGLIHRSPNMDTLVALGSGMSFLWSLYSLFAMTGAQVRGDMASVSQYGMNLYFESAAMILTLITVGKLLEAKSKGKTTDALKSLMKLAPKTAIVLRDGVETEISVKSVNIDDIFVVRPGKNIPVDGIVIEGNSAVDESALTGESIPVDKTVGSEVSSGTLNKNGFIKCRATRIGNDTTINQIIQMVSDAASSKAPIAKIADKVSGIFVPAVISVAIITFVVWMIFGSDVGFALARGISVLVISCPCALGLATPVAIMVGNGKGAKNGILFKTAESLESAGKVDVIVLDKTGTVTKGEPAVTDIIPADNVSEFDLMQIAVSLESKSEHPLAKAILKKAQENCVESFPLSNFEAVSGKGLKGTLADNIDGTEIFGGNKDFVKSNLNENLSITNADYEQLASEGKTPLFFAKAGKLIGVIAIADVIKEDSPKAIDSFKKMGLKTVMLTGDNQLTADEIGKQVGVDEVIAGVLPDGKVNAIKKLQNNGKNKVAMIGDGINDAPALTVADTGIAIGAGTDVAIDAADVVLMKGSLLDAVAAIRLSRRTLVNIKENLFWAFIYNIIGIPLAAGCYVKAFGWTLNPMFGAAAMSLSSFCVVTNALRLNFIKLFKRDEQNDFQNKNLSKASEKYLEVENTKESIGDKKMTRTLKIEGMMCQHCEKHVKDALEKIDGVVSVVTSHEQGTAVVEFNKEISDDAFKAAITDAGYTFLD